MSFIFSLSYVTIIKFILFIFGGLLALTIAYSLYHFLSKSMLMIGKSKSVFFEKSENEKLSAYELKKKYTSPLAKLIYKILDSHGNLFNIAKLEKDMQRANIKGLTSVTDLVSMSLVAAFALGLTVFITRKLIFDMGFMIILNIVAVIAGLFLPYYTIQDKVKKQEKNIRIEIPEVLDLLRQGIAAGLLFIDALNEARPKNGGSLDILIKETISKIQTSGDHVKAIYEMADKINDTKIKEFLQQLVIAYDADRDRQIEICGNLAKNVRELEDVSKNLQIDGVERFLSGIQATAIGAFTVVFLAIILYDTFMKIK